MTVSRTRMNFSASMGVASLMAASLVPSRLAGFEFNHLSESSRLSSAAWPQCGAGAKTRPTDSGTGLIGPTAGTYCENEEVRRHLPQMPRRLSPG
jgi:hypothetical protein